MRGTRLCTKCSPIYLLVDTVTESRSTRARLLTLTSSLPLARHSLLLLPGGKGLLYLISSEGLSALDCNLKTPAVIPFFQILLRFPWIKNQFEFQKFGFIKGNQSRGWGRGTDPAGVKKVETVLSRVTCHWIRLNRKSNGSHPEISDVLWIGSIRPVTWININHKKLFLVTENPHKGNIIFIFRKMALSISLRLLFRLAL